MLCWRANEVKYMSFGCTYILCACVFFLVSFLSTLPKHVNLRDPIHKIMLRGLVFVLDEQGNNKENSRKRVVC